MLCRQEAVFLIQGLQRGIPGIEEAVAQVLCIRQAPLPSAVRVAPAVALPVLAPANPQMVTLQAAITVHHY